MSQKKGILIAGTLTGLILMILLAFGFTSVTALFRQEEPQVDTTQPVAPIQVIQPVDGSSQADVQALQDYNAELENALQTMQEREAQYQQQLEAANQTITEMQQPVQPSFGNFEDDDRYEHEGYEHEEHEGFEHDDD